MRILQTVLNILRKVVYFLSKFAQTFSRVRPVWKLNVKTNRLEKTEETIDIQDEINSHYDEMLFSRLEQYFETYGDTVIDISDDIDERLDDSFNSGSNSDKVLSALQKVEDFRERYQIPDYYTNSEVLNAVRKRIDETKTKTIRKEKETNEEIKKDETQNSNKEG